MKHVILVPLFAATLLSGCAGTSPPRPDLQAASHTVTPSDSDTADNALIAALNGGLESYPTATIQVVPSGSLVTKPVCSRPVIYATLNGPIIEDQKSFKGFETKAVDLGDKWLVVVELLTDKGRAKTFQADVMVSTGCHR